MVEILVSTSGTNVGEWVACRLTPRSSGRAKDKVPSSNCGARRSAQPLGDKMDAITAATALVRSKRTQDQAQGGTIAAAVFEALNGNAWWGGSEHHFNPQAADDRNVLELERALMEAVRCDAHAAAAGTMVWALGKRYKPELRAFFLEVLQQTLAKTPPALYQALTALNTLDEPCLRDVHSFSAEDHDRNRQLAEAVLRSVSNPP
jgi:hypothetical protein